MSYLCCSWLWGGAYLVYGYLQTGEWFLRGVELKGGTAITLQGSLDEVKASLAGLDVRVRQVGVDRVLVEVPEGTDPQQILGLLGVEEASIQTVGPSLGEAFWVQAQIGIVMAFVLMGGMVFFLFRKTIPALSVIFSVVADIVVTLALMQVFAIPLTLAGLGALLMLIGYSVDTDILLASRLLRGSGPIDERVKGALKTGLTITFTTIGAMAVFVLAGVSDVITQIASVLLIGLVIDLGNTWLTNAGILRWYMERRAL